MNTTELLSRQGHRMLQIGVWLFVFSAVEGFIIPHVPAPRLGLSLHTLCALQGVMLLGLGLLWPRLDLGGTGARIAFWTYVYSGFATLLPYVMGALWGAGNTVIPLAAGPARGSDFQETIMLVVLISAAPPFFVSMALVIWGFDIDRRKERDLRQRQSHDDLPLVIGRTCTAWRVSASERPVVCEIACGNPFVAFPSSF